MDIISSSSQFVVFSVAGGFIAGVITVGILRLYELLPDKVASVLKALTLWPPLFLGVVGFLISLLFLFDKKFLPIAIICYVLLGGIAVLGRQLLNYGDNSSIKRFIGSGLLAGAAMPFMVVGYISCVLFLFLCSI